MRDYSNEELFNHIPGMWAMANPVAVCAAAADSAVVSQLRLCLVYALTSQLSSSFVEFHDARQVILGEQRRSMQAILQL